MKNVLITGASRGIGAACTRLFAENGMRVFLNYNKSHKCAEALASQTGAILCPCDITDFAALRAMIDKLEQKYGAVDVLVNNAGIAQQKQLQDITEADWDTMFNVNVKAAFVTTQAVAPSMIRRGSGAIVNVASMWGVSGASCEVHYSASKAALIGLTKALAKELGPSNIRVNAVAPGVIDTDMNAHLSTEDMRALADETPLSRIGTAEEAAHAVYFLVDDASSFVTGQVLGVDGGFL